MIIRFTRKHFGLSDYLISGKKAGSEYSRDEKDIVISLYGDLDVFASVEKYTNENKNWKSGNYIHLTCGFSPNEMDFLNAAPNKDEIYQNIVKECISYYTTGYDLDSEVIAYAEAHEPKIKIENGKERLSHIHIGISLLNPLTNTQIRVPRFNQYCDDAFKTQLCEKYGLEIPKINPKREFLTYPEKRKANFLQSIQEKRKELTEVLNENDFKSANEVISWLKQDNWEYRIAHNSKHNYKYIKVKFIDKKDKDKEHWINLRGKDFKHLEIRTRIEAEEIAQAPTNTPMNPDVATLDIDEIKKAIRDDALELWRKKHNDAVAEIRKKHETRENAKPCTISYQNKVFYERYKIQINRDLRGYYIDTTAHNQTLFRAQGVDILDTGDKLTAQGSDLKAQVALMLDIAEAKKWDLSKITITGSEAFKQEAEKQINERIKAQLQAELAKQNKVDARIDKDILDYVQEPIKRPYSPLDSAINQYIKDKPNIEAIKKYYVNGKGKAIIDKFIDSYEELKHLNKNNYQQLDNGKILNITTGKSKSIIDFFTKEAKIPLQTALAWLNKGMEIMEIETELGQKFNEKSALKSENKTLKSQKDECDKEIADIKNKIAERDKQIQEIRRAQQENEFDIIKKVYNELNIDIISDLKTEMIVRNINPQQSKIDLSKLPILADYEAHGDKVLNKKTNKTKSVIDFLYEDCQIPLQQAKAWLQSCIKEKNDKILKEQETQRAEVKSVKEPIAKAEKDEIIKEQQEVQRAKELDKKLAALENGLNDILKAPRCGDIVFDKIQTSQKEQETTQGVENEPKEPQKTSTIRKNRIQSKSNDYEMGM